MMPDRVQRNKRTGRNEDEYLEAIFYEVYHAKLTTVDLGALLDPYTDKIFGTAAVPFANAVTDTEQAFAWALQFGNVNVFRTEDKVNEWGAKIGPDRVGQCRVNAKTLRYAVILAGVQVLREHAYEVLNNHAVATQH